MSDLTQLTAAELSRLYRKGKASPVETMKAVLAQTDRINPVINAFCQVDAASSLKSARASERRWKKGEPLSALDGVPVSIKELVRVKGWPASMGSKLTDKTPADGAATLTAFTAAAIARIVPQLPKWPNSWIICGGGARNRTMMRMLRQRLEPATVEAAEGLGWSSDALEAQAFGFLAARGLKGLPLSYPATTGVPIPMTGGIIARP